MIFAIPLAAWSIMAMAPLMAAKKKTTKKKAPATPVPSMEDRAMHGNQSVDVAFLDVDGLIKSWRAATDQDTKQLKQLVEGGMLLNYSTKQVKDEYPRYKRFNNTCLSTKLSNLKKSFCDAVETRAEMNVHGGGGQGLPACNVFGNNPNDKMHQRYGADIYDDANDEDYVPNEEEDNNMNDGMSRLSMEDDFTFATQSVAMRSTQSNKAGPNVSFASPNGILRNNTRNNSEQQVAGPLSFHAGTFVGSYMFNRWVDSTPQKRISLQLHLLSGENPDNLSHRVGSNQTEYVLRVTKSEALVNQSGLEYLFPRVQESLPYIDTMEKCQAHLENHPRFVARVKSEKRIKAAQSGDEPPFDEARTPLGTKIDFSLVSLEEDPIFYGEEWVEDETTGEIHIHIELKAARKDGYVSANAKTKHVPGFTSVNQSSEMEMESIPEEISITSSLGNGTFGGNTQRAAAARASRQQIQHFSSHSQRSVRSVEVETVYSKQSSLGAFEKELEKVEQEVINGMAASPTNESQQTEETFVSAKHSVCSKSTACKEPPKKKEKKIRCTSVTAKKSSTTSVASMPARKAGFSGASVGGRSARTTRTFARSALTNMTTRSASKKSPAGPKTTGLDVYDSGSLSL